MSLEISLEDAEQRQKILRRAFETIPILIQTGELHLEAQGLPAKLKTLEGEEKIQGMIIACAYAGIMPYTYARFDGNYGELRTFQTDPLLRFPENCTKDLKQIIFKSFLEGGKIQKISIDPLPILEPEQVKEHPIKTFLDAKYDIIGMDLWTSSYKAHEMNGGGQVKNSGIYYKSFHGPSLELSVRGLDSKEEEEKMRYWFQKLQHS